ncbi:hypothetical protein UA08_01776 [Talaromyces atroroseus]|uniref:Uncharacterized protein n=1 Tax=Talaromyces atroroseus TaxID=1441469 RepID=A0A1Q5QBU9_TALAT|nr:hypothetical protein UA08_01776 [Talaromyces atroroseus]OKL63413.1 hypothetical protein UA08_01776 [Talaromyces atroroseus]
MAPAIIPESPVADGPPSTLVKVARSDSTLASDTTKHLAVRATTGTSAYGKGTINPGSINMPGMLALFAILGACFVLATIWFFFWAKNGGCVWRKGDWEEYKSTVLRRKGPDGRTLSNATTSTNLGGGSIRGYDDDDDGLTYTDMTETATTVTNEKASAAGGRKNKNKKKSRNNAKDKLLRRNRNEKWEGEADDDVRAYRQEKPARVGGINREAEGTYYGTEYTPSSPPTAYTDSEAYYHAPEHHRDHRRDTRNASGFSFTVGSEDVISQVTEEQSVHESAHTRRETRRQQRRHERERESHRSSRQSSPRKQPQSNRTSVPGGYTEPLDFSSRATNSEYQYSTVETEDDSGTKSYHHPIPGLSKGYRRDRDGGGRRRRDSLSDSD